jgi:hypothetical protein
MLVDLPDDEVQSIVKATGGKKGIMAGRRKIISHELGVEHETEAHDWEGKGWLVVHI